MGSLFARFLMKRAHMIILLLLYYKIKSINYSLAIDYLSYLSSNYLFYESHHRLSSHRVLY